MPLAVNMPQHSNPSSFYLDFDSTLTAHDTLSALSSLALAHRPPTLPPLPPFSTFTTSYLDDLDAHNRARSLTLQRNASASSDPLTAEISHLRNLRPVEDASLTRLENAGWFRGLTTRDIAAGAQHAVEKSGVALRPGWLEFLGEVQRSGGTVAVVSVNWSRRWIRECLHAAAAAATATAREETAMQARSQEGTEVLDIDAIQIVANELEGLDAPGGASGRIVGPAETDGDRVMASSDKKMVLEALTVNPGHHYQGMQEKGKRKTVYVGDSLTDLECLLAVDLGLVIRDESMRSGQRELDDALRRVGVVVRWVGEYPALEQRQLQGEEKGKIVWWATDFVEIRQAFGEQ